MDQIHSPDCGLRTRRLENLPSRQMKSQDHRSACRDRQGPARRSARLKSRACRAKLPLWLRWQDRGAPSSETQLHTAEARARTFKGPAGPWRKTEQKACQPPRAELARVSWPNSNLHPELAKAESPSRGRDRESQGRKKARRLKAQLPAIARRGNAPKLQDFIESMQKQVEDHLGLGAHGQCGFCGERIKRASHPRSSAFAVAASKG